MSTVNNIITKQAFRIWPFFLALMVFSCQDVDQGFVENDVVDLNQIEGADIVPGLYIIRLHDNKINNHNSDRYEDVQMVMRELANEITSKYQIQSEKVGHVFGHAFAGFTVYLTNEQLGQLRNDPWVKSITQDRYINTSNSMRKENPGRGGNSGGNDPEPEPEPDAPAAPWNLDRIDQRHYPLDGIYNAPNTGNNVTAYIAGYAINANHVEFESRASNIVLNPEPATSTFRADMIGSVIGGKLYGVAKNISLVAVHSVIETGEIEGKLDEMIQAIDWILAEGKKPAVVFIPIIGTEIFPVIGEAVKKLYDAGFPIFTSSGSWGVDACTWTPGGFPEVFTTGMSVNHYDYKTSGGNWGDCIDLFAPGTNLIGATPASDTDYGNINGIISVGAHSAGVAALYLNQNPSASPQQVYDYLIETSTKDIIEFSRSVNNHLLYSGLSDVGAGEIDPNRANYAFDIIGRATRRNGNSWTVSLEWNAIDSESGRLNLYVDGEAIGSVANTGHVWFEEKGRNMDPKTYHLCVPRTTLCSNRVTLSFD